MGIHSRVASIKEYVLVPAWFCVSIIKIKHLEMLSQVNSSHGAVADRSHFIREFLGSRPPWAMSPYFVLFSR